MRFVAAMPSRPGILTSISTTFGSCDAASAIASSPVAASATTSISDCSARLERTASRASCASSQISKRNIATTLRQDASGKRT